MKARYQDFKDYNKRMRQLSAREKSWSEYIAYLTGSAGKYNGAPPKDPMKTSQFIRKSPVVPSGVGIASHTHNKPEMQYSGERKLIGIAAMHKSNLVPVFDSKDAEDISKMRRN